MSRVPWITHQIIEEKQYWISIKVYQLWANKWCLWCVLAKVLSSFSFQDENCFRFHVFEFVPGLIYCTYPKCLSCPNWQERKKLKCKRWGTKSTISVMYFKKMHCEVQLKLIWGFSGLCTLEVTAFLVWNSLCASVDSVSLLNHSTGILKHSRNVVPKRLSYSCSWTLGLILQGTRTMFLRWDEGSERYQDFYKDCLFVLWTQLLLFK